MSRYKFDQIFTTIDDLFEARHFPALNAYLLNQDMKQLTIVEMLLLVRMTYRARRALMSWQDTVYRVRDELSARGEPYPEKLLAGLLPTQEKHDVR